MCFSNRITPLGRLLFLTLYLPTLRICLHSQKHANIYCIPATPPDIVGTKINKDLPSLRELRAKFFESLNDKAHTRGVQPVAHGPHAAQDSYECGPSHNRKFT